MQIRYLSNWSRNTKLLLIFFLVLTVFVTNITSALALQYWRAGRENKSSGTSIRWTGGHAYNYVMNNPRITNTHVNSIYIARVGPGYPNHYYEVGWGWQNGWSNPKWFWAKMVSGTYIMVHIPKVMRHAAQITS